MIVFVIFGFCAAYFFYLKKWAESFLSREYNFGSPSPPKVLPHSPALSILVAIVWSGFLFSGVLWGFTSHPYPGYLSVDGNNAEMDLLILLAVAVGLSYFVMYKLGEMRGVAHMKNTHLFISAMGEKHDA